MVVKNGDFHPMGSQSVKATEKKHIKLTLLVGGFNPFEKYDRQIESFPK